MKVKMQNTSDYFTAGKIYKAKRIFKGTWDWMIMAWDNFGIGRYIHGGDYGGYKIITE